MIVLLLTGMFALVLVVVAVAYHSIELDRTERSDGIIDTEPVPPGHCVLCHAPLQRAASRAEVVFELEQQIDVERAAISQLLQRPAPDALKRLYQA